MTTKRGLAYLADVPKIEIIVSVNREPVSLRVPDAPIPTASGMEIKIACGRPPSEYLLCFENADGTPGRLIADVECVGLKPGMEFQLSPGNVWQPNSP